MIAFVLMQVAVPVLGVLPPQSLPARGCAAYLWSTDRRFVAMVGADPASLRVSIDGSIVDLVRNRAEGVADLGFSAITGYAAGAASATLDMTIARRADLSAGATVPTGTLTIERTGQDSVVVPVAGVIGCS